MLDEREIYEEIYKAKGLFCDIYSLGYVFSWNLYDFIKNELKDNILNELDDNILLEKIKDICKDSDEDYVKAFRFEFGYRVKNKEGKLIALTENINLAKSILFDINKKFNDYFYIEKDNKIIFDSNHFVK